MAGLTLEGSIMEDCEGVISMLKRLSKEHPHEYPKGYNMLYADNSPFYVKIGGDDFTRGWVPASYDSERKCYRLENGSAVRNVQAILSGEDLVNIAKAFRPKIEDGGNIRLYATTSADNAFEIIRDIPLNIAILSVELPQFQSKKVKEELEKYGELNNPTRVLLEYILSLNANRNRNVFPVILRSYPGEMDSWLFEFAHNAKSNNTSYVSRPKLPGKNYLGTLLLESIADYNSTNIALPERDAQECHTDRMVV